MILRRLGRIAAAAALVASSAAIATVASVAPASATDTAMNWSCPGANDEVTIGYGDTVTITYGSGCGSMELVAPAVGTLTMFNNLVTAGTLYPLFPGAVLVYTAPATGTGSDTINFWNVGDTTIDSSLVINFPIPEFSASLTDDGNGAMTLTYENLGSDMLTVFLFSELSTCPTVPDPSSMAGFGLQSGVNMDPSPMTIAVGTQALALPITGFNMVPITMGQYVACLYGPVEGTPGALIQSLPIGMGITPTTTTTAVAPDPVTPAYTG